MGYALGFAAGALWASFGCALLAAWLFSRWGEALAAKDSCIENLGQKCRSAIGILRDRDGRAS
jgi:hypothetical protein